MSVRQRRSLTSIAFLILVVAMLPPARPALAQEAVQCTSLVSMDKRLIMEQWALSGQCAMPTRTRVTDRFLGFTCVGQSGEAEYCRSFVPTLESRAFDTAKHFRCVDLGLTGSPEEAWVSRMREWSATPNQCEWDPFQNLLASEMDFDNGQICLSAFCMPMQQLSAIGKVRLKYLVDSAFRELAVGAQARVGHTVQGFKANANRAAKK